MLEISQNLEAEAAEAQALAEEDGRAIAIRAAIEEIRPYLQRDGGDCELVGIEGNVVKIKMSGACVGCQLASVTVHGIQARLIEKLGAPVRLVPVPSGPGRPGAR